MQSRDDPAVQIRTQWERRATQSGKSLSGVLFHGLSEQANAAIHAWHEWAVSEVLLPRLRDESRVLDLGCGYGRLSKTIEARRPDITIVGQDMSYAYCRLFRESIDECVCASADALPFARGSFDGMMAITCLMYGARSSIPETLRGLRRVLRPAGALLLLDPGRELQRLTELLRGGRSHSPTGGQGFSLSEYPRLIRNAGFRIAASGGNPRLSMALLPPGIARSSSSIAQRIRDRALRQDCRPRGYSRIALHRWILALRED